MSPFVVGSLMIFGAVIGHFGLHIAAYNRINAFGWPRPITKRISKLLFVSMFVIPAIVLVGNSDAFVGWIRSDAIPPFGLLVQAYGVVAWAALVVFGVPWMVWRPIFRVEWVTAPRKVRTVNVAAATNVDLAGSDICQKLAKLPMNQIFDLSIEEICLPVVGLPKRLDGYKIAHLTDVHLTGDFKPDYLRYVIRQANAWSPEAFVLTGDIVDKQQCISWIGELFGDARAADGCYFILGNHDTRVVDSRMTRVAMNQAGWIDVGGMSTVQQFRGVDVEIVGTEVPWYDGPRIETECAAEFRLLLSHSPDQFPWARRHQFHLMLAGHTHGGQGRLPVAGPILSPSWHGSRWASGDFYRKPTTLHVSRGLGGVHLMRINCRPELSLLQLKAV